MIDGIRPFLGSPQAMKLVKRDGPYRMTHAIHHASPATIWFHGRIICEPSLKDADKWFDHYVKQGAKQTLAWIKKAEETLANYRAIHGPIGYTKPKAKKLLRKPKRKDTESGKTTKNETQADTRKSVRRKRILRKPR